GGDQGMLGCTSPSLARPPHGRSSVRATCRFRRRTSRRTISSSGSGRARSMHRTLRGSRAGCLAQPSLLLLRQVSSHETLGGRPPDFALLMNQTAEHAFRFAKMGSKLEDLYTGEVTFSMKSGVRTCS